VFIITLTTTRSPFGRIKITQKQIIGIAWNQHDANKIAQTTITPDYAETTEITIERL
jgi:hypothetical protein